MTPQGRLVFEVLRPEGAKDPFGVAEARALLDKAYAHLEAELADGRTWMTGGAYSLADVSASPSLFYAQRCHAWGDRPALQAYYDREKGRPMKVFEEDGSDGARITNIVIKRIYEEPQISSPKKAETFGRATCNEMMGNKIAPE